MTGWQMKREKKIKIKAAFCKNVRECRILTITIIVKWLLHFSFCSCRQVPSSHGYQWEPV